ncbi:MAG: glycosyltransferase family 4 protein [Methanomicrobiales archaeon]|nr:glycosyltransferase family 4 protein [Methanomicrobiales archaeon]
MNILVVQESNWIAKGPHQSHHLMERLVARGHEVRVIDFDILWRNNPERKVLSPRSEVRTPPKVIPGAFITVIRPPIIQLPLLEYASLLYSHRIEIIHQLDTFKPDVVIGFGILNARIAISQCRTRNIPFVYYIIDELHRLVPQPFFQGYARSIERENMERSDLVLSINEGLREYTISMGAAPEKTRVIRAGIDLAWLQAADREKKRKELGIGQEDIVLFFMGWLYEFSGLREVALAMKNGKNFPHVKLLVVGDGELLPDLEAIQKLDGMQDRIIFSGWRPYSEIPDFLAASDICILPAENNAIMRNIVPIKMYEYMAAGKPVIATALPGVMKEFGSDSGVVYVETAGEVVRKATELSQNGSMMHLGAKARQFVIPNDWDLITDSFEQTLGGIVHAR